MFSRAQADQLHRTKSEHGTSIRFSNGSCFPSILLYFFPSFLPSTFCQSATDDALSARTKITSARSRNDAFYVAVSRGRRANWTSKRSQASRHSDPASNTIAAYSIDFPSSLCEWTMVAVRIPDGWDPRFVSLVIERLFLFSSRYRACVVERSREACVRERERR